MAVSIISASQFSGGFPSLIIVIIIFMVASLFQQQAGIVYPDLRPGNLLLVGSMKRCLQIFGARER